MLVIGTGRKETYVLGFHDVKFYMQVSDCNSWIDVLKKKNPDIDLRDAKTIHSQNLPKDTSKREKNKVPYVLPNLSEESPNTIR